MRRTYTGAMADEAQRGPEARAHPRAPIELKVDYKRLNSFFADYTKNISKGGTFIKTTKPLPVGTRFLFRLTVPRHPEAFELLGEVVWTGYDGDDAGMGIKFVYESDRGRGDFEVMVEQLMVDSLGPGLAGHLLDKALPR